MSKHMASKHNLLVIDDDEIIWVLIKDMLQELQLVKEIQTFSDGESALAFLRELPQASPLPLIVLDLNLPYLDGFEFLDLFAAEFLPHHPDAQVYILTTSVREADRQRARSYAFVRDFISKPMKIERLKAIFKPEADA